MSQAGVRAGLLVGIDLGTQSIRALLADTRGRTLACVGCTLAERVDPSAVVPALGLVQGASAKPHTDSREAEAQAADEARSREATAHTTGSAEQAS